MSKHRPPVDTAALDRAKAAVAQRGLEMDPEDYLTLWHALHDDQTGQQLTANPCPMQDWWSRQLEAALQGSTSRQMAKSLAATERLWNSVEAEFDLPTGEEVASLLDLPQGCGRALVDQGAAIGVLRKGELRFPEFQFGPGTKQVRPVIQTLIAIAAEYGRDMEDLTLEMVRPSTYFEGGSRPVDHLDDPELPETLRRKLAVQW